MKFLRYLWAAVSVRYRCQSITMFLGEKPIVGLVMKQNSQQGRLADTSLALTSGCSPAIETIVL